MRVKTFFVAILLGLFFLIGLVPSPFGPTPFQLSARPVVAAGSSIYWGAFIDGGLYGLPGVPGDMRAVDVFESHAEKRISVLHFGQSFQYNHVFQTFQPNWFDNVRNHGSIPLIDWATQNLGSGPNQPDFQNRVVYGGAYDSYITQWAMDAKNWGHPFFLRLDWEMDGWWYPWGEGQLSVGGPIVNGNSPGDYVKMWRHVHDIFTNVGVTNVTWVWCPNHESTSSQYPPMQSLYPGDSYVDWTCTDPYNRYDSWLTFNQTLTGEGTDWLKNTYQLIVGIAPSKPLMLGEFGSMEDPNDPQRKANWITDALLTQIPTNFPQLKAVLWFNMAGSGNDATMPIESSPQSQSAFAAGIASPIYAANDFGSIDTSPIPPLSDWPTPTPTPTVTNTPAPTNTPTPTPTVSQALASDSFSRTLQDSWGNADIGGAYTLAGGAADFDVNGSAGAILSSTPGATHSAYLMGVSALDVDARFWFRTSKRAAGGSQVVYWVARLNGGNDYLMAVRIPANNSVQLQAATEVGGVLKRLGSAVVVQGLTHKANGVLGFHAQLLGANPTTLRVRVWPYGQPEPTTWQYSVTDSTASLQSPGAIGLRTYLTPSVTNAPVLFTFDDLLAQ
jgi:mannan endo-1,4-beta-mannosidase